MAFKPIRSRAGLTVAACVVVGAAAGIAGSAAAPARKQQQAQAPASQPGGEGPRDLGGRRAMFGPHGGPSVHAEEVVLNKAASAFITQTEDNGVIKAVSGNDVTLTEGTKTVTYKDVTVTLAPAATVMRNGAAAKVSDLKPGDHVHVSKSSDGTEVFAADASFRPAGLDGPGGRGHDHGVPNDGNGSF